MRVWTGVGLACAVLAGCAAMPPEATEGETAADRTESVPVAEWRYPIAVGVWYPGDGPLPEHPWNYYRVRCWPGCHDPNSQPRPK